MIMSTLMLASASGVKIAAADARLVGHAPQGDLGFVLREGDAGDHLLFHDVLLVADERAGLRIRGIIEARPHIGLHLVVHGKLDERTCSTLAPSEAFPASPRRRCGRAAWLGHDARIGGVDAVDVGVDVAALGPMAAASATALVSEAAAAQRRDARARSLDALEAGDHCDLAAFLEARVMAEPSMRAMRAEPWAASVWTGSASPARSAR